MTSPVTSLRAAFVRGGTSKGLIFRSEDLPADRADRDVLFLRALGSPDPYRRQLDGMGGGLSSLSKICVVGPPTRHDADVDYTFGQVLIDRPEVDYSGNCGNMASAIGPFAVDEGLVPAPADGEAVVRIHNVNTGRVIRSTFAVRGGRSVVEGQCRLQGVAGTAAPVRLEFLNPGGATTGLLLPGGEAQTRLPADEAVRTSLVDASNPVVFVSAADVGMDATEGPEDVEADRALLARLDALRRSGAVRMGLAPDLDSVRSLTPFVAVVAPPARYTAIGGEEVPADAVDLSVRFVSNGQPHRALPLTGALCTAVAAAVPGSVVHEVAREVVDRPIRLGSPSGPIEVDARVVPGPGGTPEAVYAAAFRTTRRLFTGRVELAPVPARAAASRAGAVPVGRAGS